MMLVDLSRWITRRLTSIVVQAAVKAMDAVEQFTAQQNITVPKNFVVAGASKVSCDEGGDRCFIDVL